MARLPRCSGAEVIRAFERAGWTWDRQKGSHVTLFKPGHRLVLTVPLHDALGPGLLRRLIRDSGLSVEQFTELL